MKVVLFSRKKLASCALGFVVLVCCITILGSSLYHNENEMANSVVVSAKENPIYYVDTDEKKVAISFDAAWGAEHTVAILDTLDKHNVKATFFLTNIWMEQFPDMTKEIGKRGHEYGLHSVSHPHLNDLSVEQVQGELSGNAKMLKDITGEDAKVFRPPFGEYNNTVIQTIKQMGFYPIQWSIDSLDWKKEMTKDDIVKRVTEKIHPGAIILCHNNGQFTAEAVEEILTNIQEQGYEVVPVGDLLHQGEYTVDAQGAQKPKA